MITTLERSWESGTCYIETLLETATKGHSTSARCGRGKFQPTPRFGAIMRNVNAPFVVHEDCELVATGREYDRAKLPDALEALCLPIFI